jgi:hypothetical protein
VSIPAYAHNARLLKSILKLAQCGSALPSAELALPSAELALPSADSALPSADLAAGAGELALGAGESALGSARPHWANFKMAACAVYHANLQLIIRCRDAL